MATGKDPFANYGSTGVRGPAMQMQTYTAGEDSGRLAELAKEFGLARQRQVRQNVRARVSLPLQSLNAFVYERMLDPTFQDVRMRSVYTSHGEIDPDDEEGQRLMVRLKGFRDEQEESVDPHAQGLGGDLVSAVLGIIKGMVGPAILYLPHGLANAGWACAIPIMICATVLFLQSSGCLLDSWKLENDKIKQAEREGVAVKTILSYPELAYKALGPTGEMTVKVGIAAMQSGVCLTYLIFVPQNLRTCMLTLFGIDIPASYYTIVMLVLQVPMSWIRDIRKLTVTNLLANILILYGLATCIGFAFVNAIESEEGLGPVREILHKIDNLEPFNDGWFLFIGTSVLLFEGSITLLVPLQEAVYSDEDRAKFPVVYRKVILGIISFYAFFGLFCWMAFGEDVNTVMTTSLPEGIMATTVQLAYSVAVIFTFPLQNFPSLEIACRSIAGAMQSSCGKSTALLQHRNVISSVLVFLLAAIAVMTMDSLDKVVSLMGSLLGCPLAFVFPPMIHNYLDPNLTSGRRFRNYVVAFLGLCAMVLASITTLMDW
eukprot:Nitzschia sp. Nitz4//scaffold86_size83305//53590//55294//NITZ4_005266-RA/size83305-snap-gene-0.162-mRNA-1//1//CDS//3329559262//2809//frame0